MADRIKERGNDREEDDYSDLEEGQLAPIVVKEIKTPMSTWGIGPVFGLIAIALTVAAILLRDKWIFDSGIPESDALRYTYIGIGCVLILAGLVTAFLAFVFFTAQRKLTILEIPGKKQKNSPDEA